MPEIKSSNGIIDRIQSTPVLAGKKNADAKLKLDVQGILPNSGTTATGNNDGKNDKNVTTTIAWDDEDIVLYHFISKYLSEHA